MCIRDRNAGMITTSKNETNTSSSEKIKIAQTGAAPTTRISNVYGRCRTDIKNAFFMVFQIDASKKANPEMCIRDRPSRPTVS